MAARQPSTIGGQSDERAWWLRVPLVLRAPTAVFQALRDDSDEAAGARQEPLLAIVWLAGIAGVLATTQAGRMLDDFELDAVTVAVWAFLAGGLYGAVTYVLEGALLLFAETFLGGLGSFRRARHLVGFAAVPLALSLAVWPVRLSLHGSDAFRTGGADEGAVGAAFRAVEVGFLVWALALLVIGIRVVHGWGYGRAAVATALPAAVPVLVLARGVGLI